MCISVPNLCQAPPPATHFVRFPDIHGSTYRSAVRAFGPPAFLHRYWDQRAFREIADGDLVVFAKGDADQPVVPFNGDDEFYALPRCGVAS
jgi:hypothetical protein